jgi:putative hydrolase
MKSKLLFYVHSGQLDWLPIGCERASACGADAEMVVNSLPVDELLAWAGAKG